MQPQLQHNLSSSLAIPLPLPASLIHQAKTMAQLQPSSQREQAYHNLLAVGVVKNYFEMLGLPVELKASDTWNPMVQLMSSTADLVIPGFGRLECRPVKPGQASCWIPPETPKNRLGLVVVELDEQAKRASLLGFLTPVPQGEVPLTRLQLMDDLLNHLEQLESANQRAVNLQQWFDGVLSSGWQTLESLLSPEQAGLALAMGLRTAAAVQSSGIAPSEVQGVTLLDLGMELESQSVALLVALIRDAEEQISVKVQLHPETGKTYLPAGVKLALVDQTGTVLKEVSSRHSDNFIQLPKFVGELKEQFHLKISHGDWSMDKAFIL